MMNQMNLIKDARKIVNDLSLILDSIEREEYVKAHTQTCILIEIFNAVIEYGQEDQEDYQDE
jgi:hypothetical protein